MNKCIRTLAWGVSVCLLVTLMGAAVPATYAGGGFLLGDVNGDGKADSGDARLILQHEVKLITLDATQQLAAEVSGDGKIDSSDARLILQFEVKLIDHFPIEDMAK